MTPGTPHLLIGYDGSSGARGAVGRAAALWPGARATVVTVWHALDLAHWDDEPPAGRRVVTRAARTTDLLVRELAQGVAREGAELAGATGLAAEARDHACAERGAWVGLLAAATAADADVLVVGSRGRTGLRKTVLGGESDALLHHSDRPVLVVGPGRASTGPDAVSGLLAVTD